MPFFPPEHAAVLEWERKSLHEGYNNCSTDLHAYLPVYLKLHRMEAQLLCWYLPVMKVQISQLLQSFHAGIYHPYSFNLAPFLVIP